MRKIFYLLVLFSVGLTSCLKSGLDELPKFSDALILDVFMEYRFEDPNASSGGSSVVRVVDLPVSEKQFKLRETTGAQMDSAIFNVTVPAASGSFTANERDKVSPSNIVFMTNISTAATMTAEAGAPKPGVPGDFSQPRLYKVTAADGSSRMWVVKIVTFNK